MALGDISDESTCKCGKIEAGEWSQRIQGRDRRKLKRHCGVLNPMGITAVHPESLRDDSNAVWYVECTFDEKRYQPGYLG